MKVYCVCIEEYLNDENDDNSDIYRVEIFSTFQRAQMYLDDITNFREDVKGDIVEYTLDDPESGDTCFVIEDDDYTPSYSTYDDDDYTPSYSTYDDDDE